MPKYKRVIIKTSGQSLGKGKKGDGIHQPAVSGFAKRVIELQQLGIEAGLVVGGGNLFRGRDSEEAGFLFDKIDADYIGMMATLFNSLVLRNVIITLGGKAEVLSAIPVPPVADKFSHQLALRLLGEGNIVVLAGGTGNPFFSTDTAAALRAAELKADVLIKATRVDGVFSSDPEIDPKAKKFDHLTYDEVISKKLQVMDAEAFAICRSQNIPIAIIDINMPHSLERLIMGESVGSLILDSK
ncbi:MAG: UMP kinase [Myxococcota bacterium]